MIRIHPHSIAMVAVTKWAGIIYTVDTDPTDDVVVRRYREGKLEAERSTTYSLGHPPVTERELRRIKQWIERGRRVA